MDVWMYVLLSRVCVSLAHACAVDTVYPLYLMYTYVHTPARPPYGAQKQAMMPAKRLVLRVSGLQGLNRRRLLCRPTFATRGTGSWWSGRASKRPRIVAE